MKQAPHLPKKDFDIDSPRIVFFFVSIVFLAFCAAIAGTLATLAWIAPSNGSVVRTNTLLRQVSSNAAEIEPLDLLIEQQVRQRSVSLYAADLQTAEGVFLPDAFLGPAAVLNAQGWAVAYAPQYRSGAEKKWLVVSTQGDVYHAQGGIYDGLSGLLYFKIEGEGFRGDISFFDWKDDPTDQLYAFDTRRFSGLTAGMRHVNNAQHTAPIWKPQSAIPVIGEDVQPGDLVLNSAGVLMGIVSEDKTIIESWHIDLQVPVLFEKQAITYTAIPATGSFVDAYRLGERVVNGSAFFVSSVGTKASSSTLAVGDIVTHVNDQPFSKELTSKYLLVETDPIKFGILRKGIEATVLVKQERVSL